MREVIQLRFTQKLVNVPDHMTCIYEAEHEQGDFWPATEFSPPRIKVTNIKYTIDEWHIPGVGKKYIAYQDNAFLKLLTTAEHEKFMGQIAYARQEACEKLYARIKSLPWWRRLFNKF